MPGIMPDQRGLQLLPSVQIPLSAPQDDAGRFAQSYLMAFLPTIPDALQSHLDRLKDKVSLFTFLLTGDYIYVIILSEGG